MRGGRILKGYKHTDETIEKIRHSKLGDKNPAKRAEVRAKISRTLKGRHLSPETEFKKGHTLGFRKGHLFYPGGEKGWMRRGDGPWECKYCGEVFPDRFSLGGHVSTNHSNGGKVLQEWLDENDPWNKGLGNPSPYSSDFSEELKEKIRKRDGYRCTRCSKTQKEEYEETGHKLAVHHIDVDKGNNNPENLLTLCNACHAVVTNNTNKEVKQNSDRLD